MPEYEATIVVLFILTTVIMFSYGFIIGRASRESQTVVVERERERDPADWWKVGREEDE